ncbi:hypothetical protein Tsubulata_046410 [Turnera subulata]|uniref:Endonuclease/exonuclease/phosphatase domain-containing protein n=1 Tax=Turnera subulata TaxID=218843 RepID=A0A9Q0FTM1_9ROSI|nr:hypothetical protein Tsubulata_046410 [Turnera subulata]
MSTQPPQTFNPVLYQNPPKVQANNPASSTTRKIPAQQKLLVQPQNHSVVVFGKKDHQTVIDPLNSNPSPTPSIPNPQPFTNNIPPDKPPNISPVIPRNLETASITVKDPLKGIIMGDDQLMDDSMEVTANSEGAGKPQFRRMMKEMANQYRPNLVIIMEPKISGRKASRVIRRLGFPNSHRVDASRFAGGIWFLWDATHVTISILHNHPQWREYLWQNLLSLASSINEPWLLSGDFNAILFGRERLTRRRRNGRADKAFVDCVHSIALIDLEFAGPVFTWKSGTRQARLDRMLCNKLWRLQYPEATVFHLPKICSDHRPLLLRPVATDNPSTGSRPFRFQAAWLLHADFSRFVKDN